MDLSKYNKLFEHTNSINEVTKGFKETAEIVDVVFPSPSLTRSQVV